MSKRKKRQVHAVGTIKGSDLIIHSANKQGRHTDVVKSGAGVHKSKRTYDRKKSKKAIRKELRNWDPKRMASFMSIDSSNRHLRLFCIK